jgi:DNA repair protein RecO (recombination protein O)
MAFQRLELGWAGRGEVQTLMKAEWQGGQPLLAGHALFCGYYLNELLLNLLPREDAHEGLYAAYTETLRRFADDVREADLRKFEKAMLQELGYGLTLEHDAGGAAIDPQANYRYEVDRGPIRAEDHLESPWQIRGQTLVDLARGDLSAPESALQSKLLMRALINHYLAGRGLETRKIFRELQEL